MTGTLARYHARSPRYILNTEDDSLIRVAGPRQIPWEEGTEIRNVSLTGLAFTAPDDLCPVLGEVIKIQFQVPGERQMASHGIVTRLDTESPGVTLVGVHFYKLDMAHRIVLAQGLSKKFREHQLKRRIEDLDGVNPLPSILPRALLMVGFLWLWTTLMAGLVFWGYDGFFEALRLLFS